ncbi:hypothetical protein NUM_23600 [Actinocatenispora comari]|uniref:Uncharacterized protein n=1 Tax=Actinocatenispora comari TaxID=2807577 RepID=A0A8J4A978_9ACTN|nr:hypothetical protein NUM_23600 [Actinocatenispora comari]
MVPVPVAHAVLVTAVLMTAVLVTAVLVTAVLVTTVGVAAVGPLPVAGRGVAAAVLVLVRVHGRILPAVAGPVGRGGPGRSRHRYDRGRSLDIRPLIAQLCSIIA